MAYSLPSPKEKREEESKYDAKKASETLETALLPKADEKLELVEKAHPSRPRKKYRGELLQMDTSSYQWFGGQITHLHVEILECHFIF